MKASQWLATADAKTRGDALGAYLKTDAKDVQHVIANNSWDLKVTPAFRSTMVDIEDFLANRD